MSAVAPRVSAKFKPYPAYRDSGVEWLGQVPEHWEVKPAKAVFRERRELSSSSDIHLTPSQAYGVLPQSEYIQLTGGSVVLNLEGADNMKHVEPGDFIIHLRSFQGGIEFSPLSGKVSMAYTVLRPSRHIETGFFKWLLKSQIYIQALRRTTDQMRDGQSIKFSQFALNALPVPALTEQQAIAALLDRETAKIDALIEKKRRLIELLKEKRAALISHAVTKGLNLTAPMKDSGIPWVGHIPAHWEVKQVKHVARLGSGDAIPSDQITEEGTFPVYGGNGHRGFTVASNHVGTCPLIGRQGAWCGNVNYASNAFWATEHAVVADMLHGSDWYWFGELLRSMRLHEHSQTAAQPGLAVDYLSQLRIPAPSPDEQHVIARHIRAQSQPLDALSGRLERQLAFLQEYRSALISAAVTGKIDVREPNARVRTPRHDFVPSTDLGSPRGAE